MKTTCGVFLLVLGLVGCHKQPVAPAQSAPTAAGAAIVEVSGGKQAGRIGSALEQPVVVQVNDDKGAAVVGARVEMQGSPGAMFDPLSGLTDSSGQFTTTVSSPGMAGPFHISAVTPGSGGKSASLQLDEVALGYEQILGRQLNVLYCQRCHDPESSPERVSNMDNLDPKPHAFTEGDTLNKMSSADLTAIIEHGGPALNRSASMPPFGYTLSKADIQALVSYIRALSDPPYRAPGAVSANK